MSDFYSIKDPKHNNIQHGQVVLCLDDWDNLFEAKYSARHDNFIQSVEHDGGFVEYHWDYCDVRKDYIADEYPYYGLQDNVISPYKGNRIVKFMLWDKSKTEGIKA